MRELFHLPYIVLYFLTFAPGKVLLFPSMNGRGDNCPIIFTWYFEIFAKMLF